MRAVVPALLPHGDGGCRVLLRIMLGGRILNPVADSTSPRSMVFALTEFVAGAAVGLLPVVIALLPVSRLVGGLRIHDRLGVGAPSWAALGLESGTFAVVAVRSRHAPGWCLPVAGRCVCPGDAYVQTV